MEEEVQTKTKKQSKRSHILDPYKDKILELYFRKVSITSIMNFIQFESKLNFSRKILLNYIKKHM